MEKKNLFKNFKLKLTDKQKKTGLVCLLFLGIAAAGCMNYFITTAGSDAVSEVASQQYEDSFAVFRQEKTESRQEQLKYIEDVFSSEGASEEVIAKAQEQKLSIAKGMESETTVEGMVKTSLGCDCVVTVSDNAVSVIIDKQSLTEQEAAQIAEIVMGQTGRQANNIKIMPQRKTGDIEK